MKTEELTCIGTDVPVKKVTRCEDCEHDDDSKMGNIAECNVCIDKSNFVRRKPDIICTVSFPDLCKAVYEECNSDGLGDACPCCLNIITGVLKRLKIDVIKE